MFFSARNKCFEALKKFPVDYESSWKETVKEKFLFQITVEIQGIKWVLEDKKAFLLSFS